MRRFTVLGFALVASACAQSPEAIAPAYVSYLQYNDLTCVQLGEELSRLDTALAQASTQQSSARTGDTWGILLLGLPTASMSGENIAPQIASYKGQEEAMHEAMTRKNCGVVAGPPTASPTPNQPATPASQIE